MNDIQKKDVALATDPLADLMKPEDAKKVVLVLITILDGLTNVVLSGDQWALATYWAKDACIEHGMSPEDFDKAAKKIHQYRIAKKRRNPLSYLHDKE
jgi:hypothetical protein